MYSLDGSLEISILAPVRRRQQKQTINAQIRIHIFVHFAVKKTSTARYGYTFDVLYSLLPCADPPVYCVWEASAQHSYKINGSPASIRDFLPITSILF